MNIHLNYFDSARSESISVILAVFYDAGALEKLTLKFLPEQDMQRHSLGIISDIYFLHATNMRNNFFLAGFYQKLVVYVFLCFDLAPHSEILE